VKKEEKNEQQKSGGTFKRSLWVLAHNVWHVPAQSCKGKLRYESWSNWRKKSSRFSCSSWV